MTTQQAVRQPVESAHPHAASGEIKQRFDAPTHFPRRFIGERDGQDTIRGDLLHLHQPSNAMD